MFPEIYGAIFFSALFCLIGVVSVMDEVSNIWKMKLESKVVAMMKKTDALMDTIFYAIEDAVFDWCDRRSAEVDRFIVFCTKILRFDLDARTWNMSAQKRDLVFHFEAGLAVCFAPTIAAMLAVLHITPYFY